MYEISVHKYNKCINSVHKYDKCTRTNAEIDLLIKHADKVLYIFHETILYLQQVNANLLHNSSLLYVNSWRFIGLTYYWPTSGSLL